MKKQVSIWDKAGKPSDWCGFDKYEYEFAGHGAVVCLPRVAKENAPFVWRTEFFDAFAMADKEMLRRGYAVVHYRIPDLFGSPAAIELMHGFYLHLLRDWGFANTCIPFGFSRGGLYAVNFAAAYPEAIAAIYLDAPVLDLKSWPAALGTGVGSVAETETMYRVYGLNRETLPAFAGNPLDAVPVLIQNRIPVVLVAGEADRDVPYAENGALLVAQYEQAGGDSLLCVILKPDCAHHPHSLENPAPICDFLESVL